MLNTSLHEIASPPVLSLFIPACHQPSPAWTNNHQGIAFMLFLHGYMKYTQPLFIQGLMTIKSTLESNPAKLHILGKKAEGDLQRPFKTAPGMMEQFTGAASGPQTDAASIKAAEKAGNKSE
jgi:hypothetical protein